MNKQKLNALLKDATLIPRKQSVAYFQRFIDYASQPLKEAQYILNQVQNHRNTLAVKPNKDTDPNYYHGNNAMFIAMAPHFHLQTNVSGILKSAKHQHLYNINPANFVTADEALQILKKRLTTDDSSIKEIRKAHPHIERMGFKALFSDRPSVYYNEFGKVRSGIDEFDVLLSDSPNTYYDQFGDVRPGIHEIIYKLLVSGVWYLHDLGRALNDKQYALKHVATVKGSDALYDKNNLQDNMLTKKSVDKPLEADYKLFVSSRKHHGNNLRRLHKEATLMVHRKVVQYCKKFIGYLKHSIHSMNRNLEWAKTAKHWLMNNPKAYGDDYVHDKRFSYLFISSCPDLAPSDNVDFDLEDAKEAHDYNTNPNNFITAQDAVKLCKAQIYKNDKIIENIKKCHPNVKSIDYKTMLSDNYDGIEFDNDGEIMGELSFKLDKLIFSNVYFRNDAGNAYREKLDAHYNIVKIERTKEPKLYDKNDLRGYLLSPKKPMSKHDYADYQLFIKYRIQDKE